MSACNMNLHSAQNKQEPVATAQAEAQVTPVMALTQASYGTFGKIFNFCSSLPLVE